MIKTDAEFECAKRMLSKVDELFEQQRQELKSQGYTDEQTERMTTSSMTYAKQCQEELEEYAALKRGELPEGVTYSLHSLGTLLIKLRIASGITQAELAYQLRLAEPVVVRHERNDWHGMTIERAQHILDALGASIELGATICP